jgi:hypothetical protein
VAQRDAVVNGDVPGMARAGSAIARALGGVASERSALSTNEHRRHLQRLQGMIRANAELVTRAGSTGKQRLDSLQGPNPTYSGRGSAQPGGAAPVSRRLGTA